MSFVPKIVPRVEEEQQKKDGNKKNWMHDMTTFLLEGRYPQGLNKAK